MGHCLSSDDGFSLRETQPHGHCECLSSQCSQVYKACTINGYIFLQNREAEDRGIILYKIFSDNKTKVWLAFKTNFKIWKPCLCMPLGVMPHDEHSTQKVASEASKWSWPI